MGEVGSNGTAMQEDGILHDSQTKTCAANAATATLVDAVETFEDAGQMFFSDAHAVVSECECPMRALVFSCDFYRLSFAGVVDGIIDKVAEYAVDERGVALDDDMLWQAIIERHVAFFEGDSGFCADIANNSRHVGALHRQLVGSEVHSV